MRSIASARTYCRYLLQRWQVKQELLDNEGEDLDGFVVDVATNAGVAGAAADAAAAEEHIDDDTSGEEAGGDGDGGKERIAMWQEIRRQCCVGFAGGALRT